MKVNSGGTLGPSKRSYIAWTVSCFPEQWWGSNVMPVLASWHCLWSLSLRRGWVQPEKLGTTSRMDGVLWVLMNQIVWLLQRQYWELNLIWTIYKDHFDAAESSSLAIRARLALWECSRALKTCHLKMLTLKITMHFFIFAGVLFWTLVDFDLQFVVENVMSVLIERPVMWEFSIMCLQREPSSLCKVRSVVRILSGVCQK